MKTVPFTIHIDAANKARLDEIARYDGSTASYMVNEAIRGMVEERDATRDLIKTGLEILEQTGASISRDAINAWMEADGERPFPEPDTFE